MPDCTPHSVAIFLTSVALLISVCLNITLYLIRRRERYNRDHANLFEYGEGPFHADSVPSDRFEEDEMEEQENPIYGNICVDGGGSFGMSEDPVCYEQMSQASTSKKNLKTPQGDVSYASLDLATNKKRRKKRKYKQAQTQPVSQQNCLDQDPEADPVTLPSRTSSLMVSRQSIYLNSHQVALGAEEREREKERGEAGEREFEMRRNLNEGFDHTLGRSRQSLEEDRCV